METGGNLKQEKIKCIICGKEEKSENVRKNISFYVKWMEYLPGQWLCRACKEGVHDKSLVRYKLQFMDQDSLARK